VGAKSVTGNQPIKRHDLDLIEKLKNGDALTVADRQQLLLQLTGRQVPSRKRTGPKSTEYRDMGIAADYLDMRTKGSTKAIRSKVSKRHRLITVEEAGDGTFNKAFERGRAALENWCKLWLKEANRGNLSDFDPGYVARQSATAKHYLRLIIEHRKRNLKRKKRLNSLP